MFYAVGSMLCVLFCDFGCLLCGVCLYFHLGFRVLGFRVFIGLRVQGLGFRVCRVPKP